jgi:hypothetical protein
MVESVTSKYIIVRVEEKKLLWNEAKDASRGNASCFALGLAPYP